MTSDASDVTAKDGVDSDVTPKDGLERASKVARTILIYRTAVIFIDDSFAVSKRG